MAKSRVLTWALWDCASTGVNAIVVTFVFSVYLTKGVGDGTPGASSALGLGVFAAGAVVAVFAPAIGVWVDVPRRRRLALAVFSAAMALLTALMSLIRQDPSYLLIGVIMLALTSACSDLATVPYNSMLRQLSTRETSGRISGIGWATGYAGSMVLLLLVYLFFISGDDPPHGLLGLPSDDGQHVRAAMLLTAAWMVLFALPVLLAPPPAVDIDEAAPRPRGIVATYRQLWADVKSEWHRDRNFVYYLLAAAVFRDGLTGIFTFGGVLGATVYGLSPGNVLLFGVAANVMAAIGAVVGGLVDDRVGSKAVIVTSLVLIIVVGATLLTLSGPVAFLVCGLLLALFVGPTNSSARTLLLRMTADGKEGVAFGLYTTTGRAVSPLAPLLFSAFVAYFAAGRAGIGGLMVVLAAGLIAMLFVRAPKPAEPSPPQSRT